MTKLSIALVGMHYRKPAITVLDSLPHGMELILQPEPDNEYDPNAVAVLVDMTKLPTNRVALLDALLPEGFSASEICAQGLFHLGYLAATGGKPARGGPGNTNYLLLLSTLEAEGNPKPVATLGSAPEGYPVVAVEVQNAEA